MKREIHKILIIMLLCALGGFLIGFNAAKLHTPLGIALFVLGIAILTMSPQIVNLIFAEKRK